MASFMVLCFLLCAAASASQQCAEDVDCTMFANKDITPGYDLFVIEGITAGMCCKFCFFYPNCLAFTWSTHRSKCYFKGSTDLVQYSGSSWYTVTSGILKTWQEKKNKIDTEDPAGQVPAVTTIRLRIPGAFCGACQRLVRLAQSQLVKNRDRLEQLVPEICPTIPVVNGICKAQLKKGVRKIVQGLENRQAPQVICLAARFCRLGHRHRRRHALGAHHHRHAARLLQVK